MTAVVFDKPTAAKVLQATRRVMRTSQTTTPWGKRRRGGRGGSSRYVHAIGTLTESTHEESDGGDMVAREAVGLESVTRIGSDTVEEDWTEAANPLSIPGKDGDRVQLLVDTNDTEGTALYITNIAPHEYASITAMRGEDYNIERKRQLTSGWAYEDEEDWEVGVAGTQCPTTTTEGDEITLRDGVTKVTLRDVTTLTTRPFES